jgi:hypothetical protein
MTVEVPKIKCYGSPAHSDWGNETNKEFSFWIIQKDVQTAADIEKKRGGETKQGFD